MAKSTNTAPVMADPGSLERVKAEHDNAQSYAGKKPFSYQVGEIVHIPETGRDVMRPAAAPATFNPLPKDPHERAEAIRQAENYRDGKPYTRREKGWLAQPVGEWAQTLTLLASTKKSIIEPKELDALREMQAAIDLWDSRFHKTDHIDPSEANQKARNEFLANPHAPEAWLALHAIKPSNHAENLRAQYINETLGYAKKEFATKFVCPAVAKVFKAIWQIVADERQEMIKQEQAYAEKVGVSYQESVASRGLALAMERLDGQVGKYERGDAFATPRNALRSFIEF